jgi:hypothetical protein
MGKFIFRPVLADWLPASMQLLWPRGKIKLGWSFNFKGVLMELHE